MKVCQVDGSKRLKVLWLMKFYTKAGAIFYLLICKLLQGSKILSNCKNNIVIQSTIRDIVLDCQIKTHNGWVARVKFLLEISLESPQLAKYMVQKKDINFLHTELGHPLEVIP